jgi:hypothetical protein
MMDSALETRLRDLLDKNEIHEVLLRYCRGVDRGDRELILGSFHPDATIDAGKGKVKPAVVADNAAKSDHVRTHLYANSLVELDGDWAFGETYFLAFHAEDRSGTQFIRTRSSRAIDQFERRDGAWKIAKRVVADDWSRVDQVLEAAAGVPVTGRRSREDAVYRIREDPSL